MFPTAVVVGENQLALGFVISCSYALPPSTRLASVESCQALLLAWRLVLLSLPAKCGHVSTVWWGPRLLCFTRMHRCISRRHVNECLLCPVSLSVCLGALPVLSSLKTSGSLFAAVPFPTTQPQPIVVVWQGEGEPHEHQRQHQRPSLPSPQYSAGIARGREALLRERELREKAESLYAQLRAAMDEQVMWLRGIISRREARRATRGRKHYC